MSGVYRGPGGTGDATGDAANASIIATQAATSATASAAAATTASINAATSATNAATSATNAATSATNAAGYVVPSQTGNSGKYLKTDGTATSWDALDISTADISGTLSVANGGTGGTTASTARTSLGLGTIATQAASAVAVTGGAIDSTPIGTTTRSSVKATTLDLGLSTQSVAIGQGNSSLLKNRIINGAMVIDQRNAGASVTPTLDNTYTLDRWSTGLSQASKFSVQQNAGSVTPPVGFSNYLGVTSLANTSLAAGDYFMLKYTIEGFNTSDLMFGTANAKTITLSFQVYSSLTGTFGGSLQNSAQNRSYPFSYSIPVANTWTTVSVTIAGDTTGTWIGATNGKGLTIWYGLGVGSTYSGTVNTWAGASYFAPTGATSVVGTSGATFYITGVQLEVGSSATGFEYRQYGQELALCQRYGFPLNGSYMGFANGTTVVDCAVQFPVVMRTSPSLTQGTLNMVAYGSVNTSTQSSSSTSLPNNISQSGGCVRFSNFASAMTSTYAYHVGTTTATTSYAGFLSAEL